MHRVGRLPSMKTHKTAPSNSVGVTRGSCERARIGVKARPGRSIGCEGMCEIQLEEGPPLHFLCIVGCRGDMWDMCGWSALFVMFVFTPYVHTRGGVNIGVNSPGAGRKSKPPPYTHQGCVWASHTPFFSCCRLFTASFTGHVLK